MTEESQSWRSAVRHSGKAMGSGVMIADNILLTAKHTIWPRNGSQVIGVNFFKGSEFPGWGTEYFYYPKSPSKLRAIRHPELDIALVIFPKSILPNGDYIPAPLARPNSWWNKKLYIVGAGFNNKVSALNQALFY